MGYPWVVPFALVIVVVEVGVIGVTLDLGHIRRGELLRFQLLEIELGEPPAILGRYNLRVPSA